MQITVERFHADDDATLSIIRIDGVFSCFGLEDEYREHKVAAETRIPAGAYAVGLRDTGGFHARYRRRFPNFHRGMLEILDVPDFKWVLIHVGNTEKDTAGCLLVGAGAWAGDDLTVQASAVAYKKLYAAVIDAAAAGDLRIQFIDREKTQ